MNPKIKTLPALKKALSAARRRNIKVVFTNGCFDILHRGHVEYLKKAASFGGILVVALNSDSSVRRLKGKGRPVTNQGDRANVLAALKSVNYVIIFKEDTPFGLIKELKPDILVKGADWDKNKIVGKTIVESYGGKVEVARYLKGYSTTNLLKKMAGRP
jgi:D-beta-D-heptose 7-phosphate kinase/D-beta-D-heptose 1-phosphate adenosyltransferase